MAEAKMKAVYQIIENTKSDKAVWRRIGTAFVNADASLNIMMDSVPLGGKVHVRDLPEPRDDGGERSEAA